MAKQQALEHPVSVSVISCILVNVDGDHSRVIESIRKIFSSLWSAWSICMVLQDIAEAVPLIRSLLLLLRLAM